jgi:thiamine-phosphate pyrophosphorylase
MKLIVETLPTFFVEEDQILTAFFEEGLDILHLRKPETSSIYSERLLTLIPSKYHKRIVVYNYFYLKDDFNLMGIHLNQYNPQKPYGYSKHISYTCSSIEELRSQKAFYDYVFLTPVYDSMFYESYPPAYTPEQLRMAARKRIIDNKVMAMGKINVDSIPEIRDYGFGGVAMTNDLWDKFDICQDKDYNALIEYFICLKKAVG